MSQEKSKTMPMQIFLGVKEVYYGIAQVENVCNGCKTLLSEMPQTPNISIKSFYKQI